VSTWCMGNRMESIAIHHGWAAKFSIGSGLVVSCRVCTVIAVVSDNFAPCLDPLPTFSQDVK
jgi:hypothetical protein